MLKHQGKGGYGTTIRLGTYAADPDSLDELVEQFRYEIEDPDADPEELKGELPLTYEQYRYALAQRKRIGQQQARRAVALRRMHETGRDLGTLEVLGEEDPAVLDFLEGPHDRQHTPDLEGWKRHLRSIMGARLDRPQQSGAAEVSADDLPLSVLVAAQRGWGKSELLKALIRHAIETPNDTHPPGAVIVIDPGGDMVQQIARWPELSGTNRRSDRLIYIRPDLKTDLTVGINPFDGTGLDHRGRSNQAGMIAAAFGELTADLTHQQTAMLRNCAMVLLNRPGSTLRDLMDMLSDPEEVPAAAELIELAQRYPDRDVQGFFKQAFHRRNYNTTRETLDARLRTLMASADFAGIFAGATTFDLGAAINARKVVLVDLSNYEEDDQALSVTGRLIVTLVSKVARARARWPIHAHRPPILLVIDEATQLAGPEIIGGLVRLRKYGLNIVLAQQVAGDGFTNAQRKALIGGIGNIIVGGNDTDMIAEVFKLKTHLPAPKIRQFWMRWGGNGEPPRLFDVRSDLAKTRLCCTDAEWDAYVAKATRPPGQGGFYRKAWLPIDETPPKSRRSPPQDRAQHHALPPRQQSPERHAPPVARATQPEAKPLGIGSPRRDRNATPSRPLSSTAPKAPDRPVAASRASPPPQVAEKPASRPTANPAGTEPYARLEPFSAAGIGLRLRKQAPAAPPATDPSERPEAAKPARSRRHLRAHKPKRPG